MTGEQRKLRYRKMLVLIYNFYFVASLSGKMPSVDHLSFFAHFCTGTIIFPVFQIPISVILVLVKKKISELTVHGSDKVLRYFDLCHVL